MATRSASDILNGLVNYLQAWVNTPQFQALMNRAKGSAEALDIYVRVQGLGAAPLEAEFSDLHSLLLKLNRTRQIYRKKIKFCTLEFLILCGSFCAKYLTDQSILPQEAISNCKSIGFDAPFLAEDSFICSTTQAAQTVMYFDLGKLELNKLQQEIGNIGSAIPFQVVFALLKIAHNPPSVLLIVDEDLEISKPRAMAFAIASMVNTGKSFHTIKTYSGASLVRTFFHPEPTTSLEQFGDVQQVLSECFAENDVINRFLRLYQVLENFMVRIQIIEVQDTVGTSFSVRDFRRLYSKVDRSESDSLMELFNKAMSIPTLIGNQTIASIIATRWDQEIHNSAQQSIIISGLLRSIGNHLNKSGVFTTLQGRTSLNAPQERHKLFSKIVYAFRNMIVHNKETEFHLTHTSIPQGIEIFMNKFLIPCVEDIVFLLLNGDRQIVWYQHPAIPLYKS